ncbi:long-chain fatty acid--CoA ligase [Flexibacterium corallicola]|uniref:long-chain fatty acid--CoA ligase n=1 Tax=Flexibacterium corallicola TaxID=3037259 RepID=UPI00286EDF90|nr:long-chain fatty acid--CoA ligase [Pseudovibrio sp. M1P-2-3]
MALQGKMMHRPLLISDILTFAAEVHGDAELVSATVEGGIHRASYRETEVRARQMAKALLALGIEEGDRVATLAWNGYRHFELYYAISGIGAVCHTINPRLSAEQMVYVTTHAEDRVLFLDLTFVPLVEKLLAQFPKDMKYVIMTDKAHMPETSIPNVLCYEELLGAQTPQYQWPDLDENAASGLCYTSGTTGNPKGVLYTHRSSVLHALMAGITFPDCLRPGVKILPVVPLFHVNAWGLPFHAPMAGVSIVFPGPHLDGASLFDLMEQENVYSSWGVPTVWLGLLGEISKRARKPEGFGEVIIGGAAASRSMVGSFEKLGVNVCHAWGMTEMSPIGTQGQLFGSERKLPENERLDLKAKQGRRMFGVELKIIDENGEELPKDGKAAGELFVRGNAVAAGYFNNEEASSAALDADGWFGTGDVATICERGFLTITDRAKDLIKSGGEWISSIDVENMAMAHPDIANCAVIAVPHAKWDERPLLVVVPKEGKTIHKQSVLDLLKEHLASWQIPDDVVLVDQLPMTATGKVSKLTLRKNYADHKLENAQA